MIISLNVVIACCRVPLWIKWNIVNASKRWKKLSEYIETASLISQRTRSSALMKCLCPNHCKIFWRDYDFFLHLYYMSTMSLAHFLILIGFVLNPWVSVFACTIAKLCDATISKLNWRAFYLKLFLVNWNNRTYLYTFIHSRISQYHPPHVHVVEWIENILSLVLPRPAKESFISFRLTSFFPISIRGNLSFKDNQNWYYVMEHLWSTRLTYSNYLPWIYTWPVPKYQLVNTGSVCSQHSTIHRLLKWNKCSNDTLESNLVIWRSRGEFLLTLFIPNSPLFFQLFFKWLLLVAK